jgi:hypothetical protein
MNLAAILLRKRRGVKARIQEYLRERAAVCLAKGALQFWVVDEDKKSVTAIHQDGSVIVDQMGDSIPLGAFGSDELAVARIFR